MTMIGLRRGSAGIRNQIEALVAKQSTFSLNLETRVTRFVWGAEGVWRLGNDDGGRRSSSEIVGGQRFIVDWH